MCYSRFAKFLYTCMTQCMYAKQKDMGYKKVRVQEESAAKISDIN